MTERDLGIQVIVVVPPPPVNLGRSKPKLPAVDELRMWAERNGFSPAPRMDEYDEDGRIIESDVLAYWKNGEYRFGDNRYCELYIAEFAGAAVNFPEVFLRGAYGKLFTREFEFACNYEHALEFLKKHFAE